MYLFQMIKLS